MSEKELRDIAALPHVETLGLSGSSIDDVALSQLAGHRLLRSLLLRGCSGITDAAIDTLISMPALERVSIDGTQLTLDGFRRLRTARHDLIIISSTGQHFSGIFFHRNSPYGPEPNVIYLSSSAPIEVLAAFLEFPHDWESGKWTPAIPLDDVRIVSLSGPSAVESMACLVPQLTEVASLRIPAAALAELDAAQVASIQDVQLTATTPADDLSNLQQMPLLEWLELEVTSPQAPDALPDLSGFQHLTRVTLSGEGVTDALVASLREIPTLQHVYIENAPVTDAGVEPLLDASHPLQISAHNNTQVTPAMQERLAKTWNRP